jgi:hypothetical protein
MEENISSEEIILMAGEDDYDYPAVATLFSLRSRNAEDSSIDLVRRIGTVLGEKDLISSVVTLPDQKYLEVQYEEYAKKRPIRKHPEHWVDGGEQIAGIHPDTFLPFFINPSGSVICRLCKGNLCIEEMLEELKLLWPFLSEDILLNNLLSFLLLLEEMDLVEL